jgi:hypothetical protein
VKSDFALLDVTVGRKKLEKHFQKRVQLGPCAPELRIPIVIHGYLDGIWGGDDGISQEFTMTVTKLVEKKR